MINYKDEEVLRGMLSVRWHPILINIYEWLDERHGEQVIVTCAYEDRDYPSTHSMDPLRAFDIRSWVFDDPQKIVDEINIYWLYDFDRPTKKTAIYHDTGRGAHIHVQVHDNTIKNGLIGA